MAWTDDQFQKELEQMINRVNEIRKIKWITDVDKNNDSMDNQISKLTEDIKKLSDQVNTIEKGTKALVENKNQIEPFPQKIWNIIWAIISVFIICGVLPVAKAVFSYTLSSIPLLIAGILVLIIFSTTILVVVYQVISLINKDKES